MKKTVPSGNCSDCRQSTLSGVLFLIVKKSYPQNRGILAKYREDNTKGKRNLV